MFVDLPWPSSLELEIRQLRSWERAMQFLPTTSGPHYQSTHISSARWNRLQQTWCGKASWCFCGFCIIWRQKQCLIDTHCLGKRHRSHLFPRIALILEILTLSNDLSMVSGRLCKHRQPMWIHRWSDQGHFKGAVKALPHMTRTELYWEYAAFAECRGIATGSYGTFMKAINKVIGPNIRDGHLRFRATNEHGQCDTCFELRKACREAKTEAARREARSRHHMHVLSQWLDRQIYWSFRTLSYNFFSTVLQANGRLLDLNWNSKLSYFACGAQLFRFPCLSWDLDHPIIQ